MSEENDRSDCRHRSSMLGAEDAYTDYEGGPLKFRRSDTVPPACIYGEAYPERFIDMPIWVTSEVFAGGPGFNPRKHCPKCPAYEPITSDTEFMDAEKPTLAVRLRKAEGNNETRISSRPPHIPRKNSSQAWWRRP